jgi:transglutaminase-like putative cysteine protease
MTDSSLDEARVGQIRIGRIRADLILLAILCVLATVPFGRIFVNDHFLASVAGASLVALAVTWAMAHRPVVLTLMVWAALTAAYLSVVVFHAGPRTTWDGLTGSWSNLLTSTVPTPASPEFLAVPVVLAAASTVTGCLLARGVRASPVPLIAPLIVLTVSLAFAGTRPSGSLTYAAALTIVALGVLVVRSGSVFGGTRDGLRRISLVVALPATLLDMVAGGALTTGRDSHRFDLRSHYQPTLHLSEQQTPLEQYDSEITDQSSEPIFTVTLSAIPADHLLPIALLEQYDGAVWGTSSSLAPVGQDLPPVSPAQVATNSIHQTYHLHGYSSAFLPVLERPVSLSGAKLGFDRTTGMLINPSGSAGSFTYSVDSEVSSFTPAEEEAARPGSDPSVAALALSPPEGWTQPLEGFAGRYAQGRTPVDRLDSLVGELRSTDFGYSTNGRGGHSIGVLTDFVQATTGDPNSTIGDAEQFAATFAVLARIEGLASRVVVGYRLPPTVRPNQSINVYPREIHVWAEVNLNGVGWVPFDPTNTTPRTPPPPPKVRPIPQPVTPSTVPFPTPPSPHRGSNPEMHPSHPLPAWLVALIVLAGAVVGVPMVIIALKRLRRYLRHRRGSPAARVVAAWLEIRDDLQARKLPIRRSTTPQEAAGLCRDTGRAAVADQLDILRDLVDASLYGLDDPGPQEAEEGWSIADEVEEQLRRSESTQSIFIALVDPRPLLSVLRSG